MAHEAAAVTKAWGDVLGGDATLLALVANQIFAGTAHEDANAPYVVGRQRSPGYDSVVFGGERAATEPLIDIGVWVENDPHSTTAQSAAKRIDVLLTGMSAYSVTDANGDSWKITVLREGGAWIRPEIDEKTKRKFYWIGGSYRFYVSKA